MDEFDPRVEQQTILMEQLTTLNSEEFALLAAFSKVISEEVAYSRRIVAAHKVKELSISRESFEAAADTFRQRATDLTSKIHALRQQKQQLRLRLSELSR